MIHSAVMGRGSAGGSPFCCNRNIGDTPCYYTITMECVGIPLWPERWQACNTLLGISPAIRKVCLVQKYPFSCLNDLILLIGPSLNHLAHTEKLAYLSQSDVNISEYYRIYTACSLSILAQQR